MKRIVNAQQALIGSLVFGAVVALVSVFALTDDASRASDGTMSEPAIQTELVAANQTGTLTSLAGVPSLYNNFKSCYRNPEDLRVADPPMPANLTEQQLADLEFGSTYPDYSQYDGLKVADLAQGCTQTLLTAFSASPQARVPFAVLTGAGNCAQQQGVFRWRLYQRHRNYSGAEDPGLGIMLVVSKNGAEKPLTVAFNCIADAFDVSGGGPPEGGSPQVEACGGLYGYDHYYQSQYRDTFHVAFAGLEGPTDREGSICDDMVMFQLGQRYLEGTQATNLRAYPSGLQTYLQGKGYYAPRKWYW